MHSRFAGRLVKFIVSGGVVLIVLVTALVGQQPKKSSPIANIPFDFFVGSQQLPAGRYQLDFTSSSVFLLHNLENQSTAQAFTLPEGPPLQTKDSKLVFFLHEGKYVLAGLADPSGKQRLSMYYGMSPGKHDVRQEVRLEFP